LTTETWLELAVLAAAGAAAARVVAMPAARRELRERPRVLLLAVTLAAISVGVVVWAALESQPALRALTGVAVAAWALAWWRARPAFGRRRGWPPGSLGLRRSLEAIARRAFLEEQVQRYGPVFKTAQFHHPVACLVGLEEGRTLLKRAGDDLVPPPLPLSRLVPRGFIRYMAPDDHQVYSRLLRGGFSPEVVSAIEPFAAGEAGRALARLERSNGRSGVDPREAVLGYVSATSLRMTFGELLGADDVERIEGWSRDAEFGDAVGRPTDRAARALHGFVQLVHERAAGSEPATPCVWRQVVRASPEAARDETVAGNLFLLHQASRESITGLVLWSIELLGGAPEWSARIAVEPDAADRVLSETLRLAQSEYVYRRVARPLEVGGYRIPAGWMLRICVAESHRLDPPFGRPQAFDPERFERRRFGTHEFSPFGLDEHACLGARMSLALARIFLGTLARDYDWTVVADGPPERRNRHWSHWTPSSAFRIALSRKEAVTPRPDEI
jgi:cytochrome P450